MFTRRLSQEVLSFAKPASQLALECATSAAVHAPGRAEDSKGSPDGGILPRELRCLGGQGFDSAGSRCVVGVGEPPSEESRGYHAAGEEPAQVSSRRCTPVEATMGGSRRGSPTESLRTAAAAVAHEVQDCMMEKIWHSALATPAAERATESSSSAWLSSRSGAPLADASGVAEPFLRCLLGSLWTSRPPRSVSLGGEGS